MNYEQLTFDSVENLYPASNDDAAKNEITSIRKYGVALVSEGSVEYNVSFDRKITDPESIFIFAKDSLELQKRPVEEFWCLCLDTKNKIIGIHMISRGNINASIATPREIFAKAILNNACSVILVHNHPSGDPSPSPPDITITKRIADAGNILGITVLDHVIIGEHRYVSFKEDKMIK